MKYYLTICLFGFCIILSGQIKETELLSDGIVFPRMNTNQRNALTPVQGQCIYNTQTKTVECYNGSNWTSSASSTSSSILDGDGDTGIETEQNADDDIIRFTVSSIEGMQFDGQSLQFINTGQSVFIGENAGINDDLSNNKNTFIGSLSGQANTTGTQNVGLGHQALKDNVMGSNNVAVGQQALQKNKGFNNIAVGFNAARDNNSGTKNIAIGGFSGFANQSGNENTFIGYEAGKTTSNSISGSVMIGHQAGMNETNNNRLIIDNTNTSLPLIYGEFDNNKLKTNGNFEATGIIKVGNDFTSPEPGTIRFNSSTDDFEGWTGTKWKSLTRLKEDGSGVTDIDGNNYKTVVIGNEEWMAENLNVERYNDGQIIPFASSNSVWSNLITGAMCFYNNDSNNETPFGKLYNWYAVDSGKLCPVGWHVPTGFEYDNLRVYLGGFDLGGGKMKETGTANWDSPNSGATNESGFTGLGGGNRNAQGSFVSQNNIGVHWTSTTATSIRAETTILSASNTRLFPGEADFNNGNSVRCVKD